MLFLLLLNLLNTNCFKEGYVLVPAPKENFDIFQNDTNKKTFDFESWQTPVMSSVTIKSKGTIKGRMQKKETTFGLQKLLKPNIKNIRRSFQ